MDIKPTLVFTILLVSLLGMWQTVKPYSQIPDIWVESMNYQSAFEGVTGVSFIYLVISGFGGAGCVLVPIVMSAIVTSVIFAFYWIWRDLFQPLIFISIPQRFIISLTLNLHRGLNSYGRFVRDVRSVADAQFNLLCYLRKRLAAGVAMDM